MTDPPAPSPVAGRALAGKVAVVTGASSGAGRAVAMALAGRGADLWLLGRDRDRLADAARTAAGLGVAARAHPVDLAVDADLEAVGPALEAAGGGLDLLVHAAAVIVAGAPSTATAEALDLQYRVNLRAPFLLTRSLLPLLVAARGQVVFVNSSAGLRSNGSAGAYSATKAGLRSLADSFRDEVNPLGVRVLSVFPGSMATPMQEQLHRSEGKPYDPARLMQADDLAEMVAAAVALPPGAEVTEIVMRPTRKG